MYTGVAKSHPANEEESKDTPPNKPKSKDVTEIIDEMKQMKKRSSHCKVRNRLSQKLKFSRDFRHGPNLRSLGPVEAPHDLLKRLDPSDRELLQNTDPDVVQHIMVEYNNGDFCIDLLRAAVDDSQFLHQVCNKLEEVDARQQKFKT